MPQKCFLSAKRVPKSTHYKIIPLKVTFEAVEKANLWKNRIKVERRTSQTDAT